MKKRASLGHSHVGNIAPASTPHPATLRVADLPLKGGGEILVRMSMIARD